MWLLFLLKCGEQSKNSFHFVCSGSTPGSRKTRLLGAFTSDMDTPLFYTAYVTTLETLQYQSLPYKSCGVEETEQCVVSAR